MGVVYLWAGRYEEALECFEEATEVRMECLVKDHPDIVVYLYNSMSWIVTTLN